MIFFLGHPAIPRESKGQNELRRWPQCLFDNDYTGPFYTSFAVCYEIFVGSASAGSLLISQGDIKFIDFVISS
ncbi:MAG: hypothetical protein ACT6Q3_04830, partial [Sphingopyxis sp.]